MAPRRFGGRQGPLCCPDLLPGGFWPHPYLAFCTEIAVKCRIDNRKENGRMQNVHYTLHIPDLEESESLSKGLGTVAILFTRNYGKNSGMQEKGGVVASNQPISWLMGIHCTHAPRRVCTCVRSQARTRTWMHMHRHMHTSTCRRIRTRYTQIGNAVSPMVAAPLGRCLVCTVVT
jgi:hypothetical protein